MSELKEVPTLSTDPAPVGQRVKTPRRRATPVVKTGSRLWGLLAWAVGLLFVLPVFFMVLTSFHSETDAATNPPSVFAPLTLDGYRTFFGVDGGGSPVPPRLNSLMASLLSTLLVLLLSIKSSFFFSI